MKKAKMIGKKTLSVFLAVLMVLTAWVWIAPQKAEAAAGSYYVKITWKCTDAGDDYDVAYSGFANKTKGNCAGISLYYKSNNGTGTESEKYWDFQTRMKTKGTYTETATISGFPTYLFVYNDAGAITDQAVYEITKIEIGASSSSTLTTLWSGSVYMNSTNQIKSVKLLSDGTGSESTDDKNAKVTTSSVNWVYPYANTFTWSPENLSAMTCPKTASDAAATQTVSVTAKDQYGVQMFDPTWKVSGNIKSTGITVSPTTSSGSTTISVNSSANILNTTNSQTGTVTATWSTPNSTGNTSKTSSKDFTINDATYTAIFKNHKDANGVTQEDYTTTAQYGVIPTAPTASNYSAGDYDYTFTGWNPSVTGISGDTTYVAGYSQSDKILADYTAVNEAIAAANAIKTQCGTEYELMYTIASRVALDAAINAVVTGLGRTQQSTVDGYAKAINDALNLEPNKFDVIFLDKDGAILLYEKDVEYKKAVTAPSYSATYYDSTNHYTFTGWDTNEYTAVTDDLVIQPVFSAEAHTFTTSVVPSTCVQKGATKYTCSCGYSYVDGETDYGDHAWEDDFTVDIEPTCVLPGSKSIHCTLCDAQKDITVIEPKGHSWEDFAVAVNPTCTNIGISTRVCAEKDCRFCEHLVIDALGHDYKKTTVAPTCTAKGYDEYVCQRENCGHSYRDNYTNVVDHSLGEWITVSEAHCEVAGVKKRVCKDCTYTELDSIDALKHDDVDSLQWNVIIEDTCTDKGYRTKTCSKCQNIISAEAFDEIKTHDIATSTTDATCTTAGSIVKTCQRENCGYTDTYVISALGHKYEKAGAITETAATCTSSAYKTYKCDNCNYTYKEYVSGSTVESHTWTKIDEEAADCTEDGFIKYKCSVCNEEKEDILPRLGHSYSDWDKTTDPATNDKDGKWTRICSKCNDVEEIIIPMGGHVWDNGKQTLAPTCTTPGKMVYSCSKHTNCGITIEVTVPVKQHSIAIDNKEASCTEKGHSKTYCSVCKKEFNSVEIPVKAHNFVAQTAVAPTCTTAGYTPHKCSACSFTYNVVNGAQALGHNYNAQVTKAPGCTTEGETTYTCQNDNSHKYTETIPATGHTYDAGTVVQNQSCTDVEKTEYKCACGDKYTVITKEAKGHTYTNWTVVTPATADKYGVQKGTCSCGDVKYDVLAPIGAHIFTAIVTKDPTCTEKGEKTFTCTVAEHGVCSANYTAEIPATGHTQTIVYTAPTCIAAGSSKVICSVESCKAEILSTSIPAIAYHNFSGEGEVTTAPTCTATGIMTYTCTTDGCTAKKTETIPAKGHVLSTTVKDAECGEKGSVVTTCANCSYSSTTELTAKGHIWKDNPESTVDAKCEIDGSKTYKCNNCDAENVVVLPKLGHKWGPWTVAPSTNGAPGSVSRTCSTCNKTESVEIPAGGHKLVVDTENSEAATCTKEGKTVYKCEKHADCGVTLEVTVPVREHLVVVEIKEATCTAEGYIKQYCAYTNCNEVINNETTKKLAHVYTAGTAVAPTCTTSGYTPYKCDNCTSSYNMYDADKSATGHNFTGTETVISAATCTADGSKTVQCKNCSVVNTVVLPKTGHNYTEDTSAATNATCTALATKTYKCACGASYVKHEGKLADHKFDTLVKTVPATNESLGYEERKCDCGLTEITIIEATGTHVFNEKIEDECIAPTCTKNGTDVYKCTAHTDCGVKSSVLVPRLGHSVTAVYKAPTCSEKGSSEAYCVECKNTLSSIEIPAKGHAYNTVEITTEPECESKGTRTYSCSCGASYTEEIPAKGHNLVTTVKDATCTDKGLVVTECTVCKKDSAKTTVELAAKNHNWNAGVENPKATCTSEGTITYTCTVDGCGETKTETVEKLGHDWGDWTVTPSTNNDTGSVERKCKNCTETETVEIPAGGHDLVVDTANSTDASCSAEGTLVYKCNNHTDCGITVSVTVPKTQHVLENVKTDAECEKSGSVVTRCTKCNVDLITTFIPAKGHTITVTTTHATCTTDGSVVEYCDGCKKTLNTTTIAKLGHDFNGDSLNVVNATCEVDGSKDVKCTRCDITTHVIIPHTGHDYGEWVKTEATNDKDGSWYHKCANCGKEETLVIPAGGHNLVEDTSKYVAPTCIEKGKQVYKCTAHENCSVTVTVELDYAPHKIAQREIEATCTKEGSVEAYCSVCNVVLSTEIIPVKAHEHKAGTPVAPTCTTSGYTPYTCSCGDTYNVYDAAKPATPHKLVESTSTATCTTDGLMTLKCDNAGCTYSTTVKVPALGHNYVENEAAATDATCKTAATETYKCSRCDSSYTISVGEKATDHKWGAWEVKESATPSSLGYQTSTCTVCGQIKVETIPATGEHNFNTEIRRQAATCTTDGWIEYGCSTHTGENACGKTSEVKIPATGHTEKHDYKAATCTETGYSRMVCTAENNAVLAEVVIPKLGHDWNDGNVTNATCKTEGEIVRTCSRGCKDTNITKIPVNSNAHQYETKVVPATCYNAGSVVTKCKLCDKVTTNETLAQLNHDWSNGEVTTKATCTSGGVKTYTCSVCKTTKTEPVDALGHDWGAWEKTDATNSKDGEWKRVCKANEDHVETLVIPKGGHTFGDTPDSTTPATCTATGKATYNCTAHTGANACGITITVVLDKLQHKLVKTEKQATCESTGEVITKCENCDTVTYTTVIPATGHTFDEGVKTDATCTSEGRILYTCTAEKCGKTKEVTLTKLQHNYVAGTPVAATCTSNGYTPYKCETCDSSYVILGEAAKGHRYTEKVTSDATCTAGGTLTLKCADCSETMKTPVPAIGHDYEQISSTLATCVEAATETYKCNNCDAEYKVSVGSKTDNHKYIDNWTEVEKATEESIGYKTRPCEICGQLEVQTIEATGEHAFTTGEIVKTEPASCEENGYEIRKCSQHKDCGKTGEIILPALGHTEVIAYTAPSCTAEGSTSIYCTRCTETIGEEKVLAKLDHVFEVESITNATCKTEGSISLGCKHCDATDTVKIPVNKEAHKYIVDKELATCTKDGYVIVTCDNKCGYKDETTIPMLQHSWGAWDIKPSTYTEPGSMSRVCSAGCIETVVIPAGGHAFDGAPYSIDPATCKAEGSATYKCSVHENCGVEVTVVLPTVHHELTIKTEAATCTKEGAIWVECINCDYATEKTATPKLAHKYENEGAVEVTDPTCTKMGYTTYKCDICGETHKADYVKPNGHSFVAQKPVAPTCTEMGYTTYKCACGVSYSSDFVKPTGHKYNEGEKTDATCTAAGKIVYTCTAANCGHSYEVTLSMVAHVYVVENTVDPTCTANGYTTYKCKTCESRYVVIGDAAKGHNYENVGSSTATCTEGGTLTLWCACGAKMETAVPALGHNYIENIDRATDATCAAAATKTFECDHDKCDAEYTVSVGTKTETHDWNDWSVAQEPTYTSIGYKTRTCKVCEKLEVEVIKETGDHDLKEVDRIDPTCTEEGTIYYECEAHTNCGIKSEVKIPALGHTEKLSYTAATCTDAGFTKMVCTVDGCDYEADVITIPALGHAWNEEAITVVNATCKAEGTITLGCNNCDAEKTVKIPVNADAHKLKIDTKDATCKAEGSVTITCENSGCIYKEVTPIPMLQHSWSTWDIKPSTYFKPGSMTRECLICKETETVEIPAGGHEFNDVPSATTAATCTAEGTATYKCTVHPDCGVEVTVKLPKVHHDLKTETVDASCTKGGSFTVSCKNCDYEEVVPTGIVAHKYEEFNKVDATCTTAGYTIMKCKNCEATYNRFDEQPKGHDFNDAIAANVTIVAAKCEEDGSKTVKCSRDGCSETKVTVIPATGHKYESTASSTVTAPKCTAQGYTTYTCDVCKAAYTTNFVKPNGHEWGDWKVTAGATGDVIKRVCKTDANHTEQYEIPAGGHSFDTTKPVSTVPGTCQSEGSMSFSCTAHSDCGVKITVNTGKGDHNWSAWEIKAATNDADGYWKHECLADGCNENETLVIPRGHYIAEDTEQYVKPECNKKGQRVYTCTAHENCSVKIVVVLEKIQHTPAVEKVDPSCLEDGYVRTYCSICKETLSNVTLAKQPHNYDKNGDGKIDFEDASYTPPKQNADGTWTNGFYTFTCQTNGCKETKTEDDTRTFKVRFFDAKGVQIGETQEISSGKPATAPTAPVKKADGNYHYIFSGWDRKYDVITSDIDIYPTYEKEAHTGGQATCTAKAECEKCGEPYGSTDASKHKLDVRVEPASCEKDGKLTYYCTNAGCDYEYHEKITAPGHKYGDWEVYQNGNCATPFIRIRKCQNFGCDAYEQSETYGAHTWYTQPEVAPTCTTEGHSAYKYCTTCGVEIDSVVIPKLPHRDNNGDGNCDYCTFTQIVPSSCKCMCHSTGFMKFIYAIVRFFWKLSGSSPVCNCGIRHY